MKISLLLCILTIIVACKNKESSDVIIIQGDVKGIPDGKVYLTDAYRWIINLDSTAVKNGKFEFRIKADSSFYPYLVAIHYPDSNNTFAKISSLIFVNTKSDGFYLEKGLTLITIDTVKPFKSPSGGTFISANVQAGKQNEAYVQNLMSDFGWLGNLDSTKRNNRIQYFKNQIRKYSYSYYLLDGIYNARNQYSETEWKELLILFDKDVQSSALGTKVRNYLATRRSSDSPYPNLSMNNSENKKENIIDSSSNVNMLVFWASWCKPCREELPELNNIFKKYRQQKFNIVSISVDEDELAWKKALKEDKIQWPQLIVGKEQKVIVDGQFDASAIPLVILTDKAGHQLARFVGYEKGQELKYDSIIATYINKN